MSVPVRPDGKLAAPLSKICSPWANPSALARDIEKELSKFIRDPVVTVIVTTFVGPYSEQIRVIGQAAKPSDPRTSTKMTVLDVMMIAVGG